MAVKRIAKLSALYLSILLTGFVIFFYVIPIYNFKNVEPSTKDIIKYINEKDWSLLANELHDFQENNLMNLKVDSFVNYIRSQKNHTIAHELSSSDDYIISVSDNSYQSRLVLSQRGFLSKWKLINIRYVKL